MLDRNRSFATVYGDADHTYIQDGKKFDHEGKELGAKVKVGKVTAPKVEQPESSDQVGAQLAQ